MKTLYPIDDEIVVVNGDPMLVEITFPTEIPDGWAYIVCNTQLGLFVVALQFKIVVTFTY